MLSIGIVDANEVANARYAGLASSVVGQWLAWEVRESGMQITDPSAADVILLAFAGALDWHRECIRELRRRGVVADAKRRGGIPYIITGGPIDAAPLTALDVADALAVGEGYAVMRELLERLVNGASIADIDDWLTQYPHAITRSQVSALERDKDRPWLLAKTPAQPLATPDDRIDWGAPAVKSSDNVTRIVASKGCHMKCAFCATTYRQKYQINPNGKRVLRAVGSLASKGQRVQLLSNDPLNIPWFKDVTTRLDSESFTIQEVADDNNRAAIIRSRPRMARFGVEGLTERIRRAFAKPIKDDRLLHVIGDLHSAGINTHMFYIVGAPYETSADWDEFRAFYSRLALHLSRGICRVKFTTFIPTPPAPLSRYVPGAKYEDAMTSLRQWIGANAASRHIVYVRGRGNTTRTANVAEQLSVSRAVSERLCASRNTVDLAPTVDDWRRMPHSLIDWPINIDKQWRIAERYRTKLTERPGK